MVDADEVVGRGTELAAIEDTLDHVPSGLAAGIRTGEAGIGKSTVWEAAVESARTRGWQALVARPAASEQSLTLAGLTDLLGPVDEAVIAGLPAPQRTALEVALLRVEPTGAPPDQRTLSVALTALLRQLASERPLLLAIDDLHWLDAGSASILAYALRRATDLPVGLLASLRTGEASRAGDELLTAIPADRIRRLAVGPLHLAALHRLFELRLGRSFPRVVLLRIEAASGGNPLFALELARALAAMGTETDPHADLPVPESLAALIASRVSRLPEATQRAMLVASAASEPTLATLATVDPGIEEALGPAVDDGLLAIDGGAVRFRHPLFAQSVTSRAPAADLRAAHRALADASRSPDARARHLAQAADGPDEAVAATLADAAGQARIRGATLDAAGLYREASRLTQATLPDAALDRARLAAECLFIDLSEYTEADRILEAAIAAAPPGPARANAVSLRGILRYYHGRGAEGIELAQQALDEVGDDPNARATVLGRLAYLAMQVDLARGLELLDEAVGLLEAEEAAGRSVDPDTLANAVLLRANGELGARMASRPGAVERGIALISVAGRSWEKEGAEGSAFGLARHTDDLDRAIAITRDMIRLKSGPGGDDPFNVVMLSGLLLFRGAWAEARQAAEAAEAEYRREGAEVHPAWALRGLALVAAHDGRTEDAKRWAADGLGQATARGDLVLQIFHRHILGFVALTEEAWSEADAQLTAAAEIVARAGVEHPGRFKLAGDQAEAALALGDVDRARAVVDHLRETARIAPTPWVVAVGLRSEALLAAARGNLDAAAACMDAALHAHEALPMPFERARTLLAKGRLHRRRKEKRLADETLREALATFERLGAPDWAAKARLELGRVGRRPHAPHTLTETELRVAELAATGLTSREIAERAFLAPKTVGNVLGRVYEKLGIHSRAELGAVMASIAAAGETASRTLD